MYNYPMYDTSIYKVKRIAAYAIRKVSNKERVTYRFRSMKEFLDMMKTKPYNNGEYEMFRTSQSVVGYRN